MAKLSSPFKSHRKTAIIRALGFSSFTVTDTFDELNTMIRDAVSCHFDEIEKPSVIRLHMLKALKWNSACAPKNAPGASLSRLFSQRSRARSTSTMPRSTRSFLFPDINVWLALSYQRHIHYPSARGWFERLEDDSQVCFCRFTQLRLLRLLTTGAVIGEHKVLSRAVAWVRYERRVAPMIPRIFCSGTWQPRSS